MFVEKFRSAGEGTASLFVSLLCSALGRKHFLPLRIRRAAKWKYEAIIFKKREALESGYLGFTLYIEDVQRPISSYSSMDSALIATAHALSLQPLLKA